jgi:hypothetical protein
MDLIFFLRFVGDLRLWAILALWAIWVLPFLASNGSHRAFYLLTNEGFGFDNRVGRVPEEHFDKISTLSV